MSPLVKIIQEEPSAVYGKGATEKEISEAEAKLNLKFAPEYREYLSKFRIAAFDGREFTGLSKSDRINVISVTKQHKSLNQDIAADWYVIEEANIDGIVIWQNTDGNIYQTVAGTKSRKIANSFAEYIAVE